jgi:hypothetical protein
MSMMMTFREMWPNRVISENTIKLYYLILENVSDDDLAGAMVDCLETCKFFPVPSEIVERIPSTDNPTGEEAFEMCLRASNIGELSDAIKRALHNIGGLSSLRERDVIQMRRAFLESYSEMSKVGRINRNRERAPKLLAQIIKNIPLLEASDG